MTAATAPVTMPRPAALACLLLATIVWGLAFIAQKSAMSVMGPLTFLAARISSAACSSSR